MESKFSSSLKKQSAIINQADFQNDPIGLSIAHRESLGSLQTQITDLEAQKKKIQVFRAPKLPTLKGNANVDFNPPPTGAKTAQLSTRSLAPKTASRASAQPIATKSTPTKLAPKTPSMTSSKAANLPGASRASLVSS